MLQQIEHDALIEIINQYISKSLFYKNKYQNNQVTTYSDIPFLTKQELLDDQSKNPPFGSNLCVDMSQITRIHRTSGSTNKPLLIALTNNDLDIVTEIGSNLLKLTGMNSNDIVINCLNYNMWMGGYTDHQSMEKTGAAVIPFGIGNTDSLILLLKDLNGASLHCTPSYLSVIKEKLENFNLTPKRLNIKNGYFGAEGGLQDKNFRAKIEEEWGLSAYNANYGLSEVISILGSECVHKDGLHFGALGALYIELVDENFQSIDIIDGAIGELVITHLRKESQPLIRYRTGDIFEIISLNNCSCGFQGFKFKINGRVDDMLVVKGVNFFPESIRNFINQYKQLTGVYKIVAPKVEPIHTIKLLIETNADKNEKLESIKQSLLYDIKANLNISPEIEFIDNIQFFGNKMKLLERV